MTDANSTWQGKHGPLLIAEVGGNHEGDFEYALHLTDLAIDSGADCVKFQLYTGDSLVSPVESPDRNAHFQRFELSREQHLEIAERCKTADVRYAASVWNPDMLEWIDPYLDHYKIGSGDLTAWPIIEAFTRRQKPLLLSTGLATLNETLATIRFIEECNPAYRDPEMIAVMQCTAMYPIDDTDANLRVMDTLREATGRPVGYSDHTRGTQALTLAAARDAQVLEFHFTDSREGKSFRDHKVSLTRDEVKALREQLDQFSELLGSADKQPLPCEIDPGHVTSFRRGLYSRVDLKAGEEIQQEHLVALRPNHGIDARRYRDIIGKRVKRDTRALEALDVEE
ncbi:N-acetylneuraminate synthase family protein [Wenzhouxiangella sp. EGI_FJ10409]|uniref:N-acetylneuraminate synthase family protein n=1 Tax=Wenzhouxiangella sp. EGI_FJ10409 TaxID=3243767 RepID=UPI0035D6E0A8